MHRVGRFCHRNRRFVFSAATVIATAASVPDISWKSRCSGASSSSETSSTAAEVTLTIVVNDDDTKDAEWEIEKEKCSFCKQFLQSPCKHEFRRWSKCVDMAKVKDIDFVKACSVYTNALMDCTSANNDFFAELNKSDDINEEAEDQSSTNEEDEKKDGESEISGREVVASTNEKETLD